MRPLALIPFLCLAPLAAGQDAALAPRWLPEKSLDFSSRQAGDPHGLVLKVRDDAGARAVDGRLTGDPARLELAPLLGLLELYPGTRVEPLIGMAPATLAVLRTRGQQRTGRQLADMTQYFRVTIARDQPAGEVLRGLLALDVVENAYVEPPPPAVAGDVLPPTGDFVGSQGYRDPAPVGIDADYANVYVAGDASGITVCDVEWDWQVTHEDLSTVDDTDRIGLPTTNTDEFARHHGTAVAGEIVADPDGSGVTGLAPGARFRFASIETAGGGGAPAALLASAAALSPGDVILIEVQGQGPNEAPGVAGWLPLEYWDADFNAIQTATANGIFVVEAAGNGSQDFDSTVAPFGDPSYPARFDIATRNSGAFMIAAGSSGPVKTRLGFSNHGERVDAFAWGQHVVTLGYGERYPPIPPSTEPTIIPACDQFPSAPDEDQFYTRCFSGTSSASPIVTSAVAIINAVHRSAHGTDISVEALRGLLRTVGTTSVDSGMSRQPDLSEQLPRIGAGALLNLVYLSPNGLQSLNSMFLGSANGAGTGQWGNWVVGRFEQPVEGVEPTIPGAAMMMNGQTGEIVFEWEAPLAGCRWGASLLDVGDFDFDGLPDVGIGAPGGLGSFVVHSSGTGEQLFVFDGEIEGEDFGAVACRLGDLDGDGVSELAIAAPMGNDQTGRVLLFSGKDGTSLGVIAGENPGERFGSALALVDDMDGNGWPDLAIGAPGVPGQQGESKPFVAIHSTEDGKLLFRHEGEVGSRFGSAVVTGPDMDGDDKGDLFVGAPGQFGGEGTVFEVGLQSGVLGSLFNGSGQGDEIEIGLSLAMTDDRDGDGVRDLIVGAPGAKQGDVNGGAAYLLSGANGQQIAVYASPYEGSRFGTRVAGGDLDGDGVGDVFVNSLAKESFGTEGAGSYSFLGSLPKPPAPAPAPSITQIEPASVPAVVADGPATITLTGANLETVVEARIGGVDLRTDEIAIIGDALELQVPQLPSLGSQTVEIETLGGSASAQLVVIANATPTLDVRTTPEQVAYAGEQGGATDGVIIIIGDAPGNFGFTLVSQSLQPSVVPGLFDLGIGAGLTDLFLIADAAIGPQGWTSLELPSLPVQANPYDLHFQGLSLDGQTFSFPLISTNVDSITINP